MVERQPLPPACGSGNALLSQPCIMQRLEATVKQRHMSYTLHKMNNSTTSLQSARLLYLGKRQEGVYEHGETFPKFSFSFIYGSCVARRDKDRSDRVAGQSTIAYQWRRALLSRMGNTGSPSCHYALRVR